MAVRNPGRLTPDGDCHVEPRVIANDYTFTFAGRRYQIARDQAQAGMRQQRLRVELRLNGELHARYQQRYLSIAIAARAYLALSRRCANRYAKITTPEARAPGCRAFLIAPVLRCGKRSVNETHLVRRASPAILALNCPKPPLRSFTKSTCRPGTCFLLVTGAERKALLSSI